MAFNNTSKKWEENIPRRVTFRSPLKVDEKKFFRVYVGEAWSNAVSPPQRNVTLLEEKGCSGVKKKRPEKNFVRRKEGPGLIIQER